MQNLCLFMLLLLHFFGLSGQTDRSHVHGKWASKYGLYLDFSDSNRLKIPNIGAKYSQLTSDTLTIYFHTVYYQRGGNTDSGVITDSQNTREPASFLIRYFLDSLEFFAITPSAQKLVHEYSGAPKIGYYHNHRYPIDVFPKRASPKDKIVLYPIVELYHKYEWDTLYFSIGNDGGITGCCGYDYDLIFTKSGKLHVDHRYRDNFFSRKKEVHWEYKSFDVQISQHQMDTIRALVNMSNLDYYWRKTSCSDASIYRLKLNCSEVIASWAECDDLYVLNLTPVSAYLLKILRESALQDNEVSFNGFQSPCTFVNKNR